MFPSSTSQGLHNSGGTTGGGGSHSRYASAPSSNAAGSTTRELSSAVGFQNHLGTTARFFPSSDNSEPMAAANRSHAVEDHGKTKTAARFQPSTTFATAESSSSSLVRHNSSPPGLINQLAAAARDSPGGFSIVRDNLGRGDHSHAKSRMSTELDFSIAMRPWDDGNVFSVGQNKHDGVLNGLHNVDSQFQFSLGMPSMEKMVNIPQDSVPCKIRAKRGCATHPRSIAERERRTRISGKLKKLHDLVPNMDKQTSYADMLELAVQHIKTLQTRVQKLNNELEGCTCGCKDSANS